MHVFVHAPGARGGDELNRKVTGRLLADPFRIPRPGRPRIVGRRNAGLPHRFLMQIIFGGFGLGQSRGTGPRPRFLMLLRRLGPLGRPGRGQRRARHWSRELALQSRLGGLLGSRIAGRFLFPVVLQVQRLVRRAERGLGGWGAGRWFAGHFPRGLGSFGGAGPSAGARSVLVRGASGDAQQRALRLLVAAGGRLTNPVYGPLRVTGHSQAIVIQVPERVLGIDIPLASQG